MRTQKPTKNHRVGRSFYLQLIRRANAVNLWAFSAQAHQRIRTFLLFLNCGWLWPIPGMDFIGRNGLKIVGTFTDTRHTLKPFDGTAITALVTVYI